MRLIDLKHLGRPRVIACWEVGDVLIDPGPSSCLDALLGGLEEHRPAALLLTHIHLDHAGASGSLVRRWPELEVFVHERGAQHLIDPSRLLGSAQRLYGEDMGRLWGEVLPVPEENVRVLTGGETVRDGFETAYTPGHASHHVSYLHEGTAFVGDVAGVRIMPELLTIPPTPPPDIDLAAWQDSLDQLRAWSPDRLAFTHFGCAEDVKAQLDELGERLEEWAAQVRRQSQEEFIAMVEQELATLGQDGTAAAYTQAAPPEQLYAGLARYWQKRAGTASASTGPPGTASASGRPPVS